MNVSANSVHLFWGWNLENLLGRHRQAAGLQGNSDLDLFWGHSRRSNFVMQKASKTQRYYQEFYTFCPCTDCKQCKWPPSCCLSSLGLKRHEHEKEEGEREENLCWFLHTKYMRKLFWSSGLHKKLLLWSMALCRKCSQLTFATQWDLMQTVRYGTI